MKDQAMPYDIFMEALHDNEVDALKANPVLVLCDDAQCADRMVQAVRKRGLEVMCCSRVSDAHSLLSRRRFSLVLSSDTLPDGGVRSVIEIARTIPVVVFSRRAEWDAYLEALNHGAFDYIACPHDSVETERILTLALSEPSHDQI
jgi:DNA-binding NtrC family response regulator